MYGQNAESHNITNRETACCGTHTHKKRLINLVLSQIYFNVIACQTIWSPGECWKNEQRTKRWRAGDGLRQRRTRLTCPCEKATCKTNGKQKWDKNCIWNSMLYLCSGLACVARWSSDAGLWWQPGDRNAHWWNCKYLPALFAFNVRRSLSLSLSPLSLFSSSLSICNVCWERFKCKSMTCMHVLLSYTRYGHSNRYILFIHIIHVENVIVRHVRSLP